MKQNLSFGSSFQMVQFKLPPNHRLSVPARAYNEITLALPYIQLLHAGERVFFCYFYFCENSQTPAIATTGGRCCVLWLTSGSHQARPLRRLRRPLTRCCDDDCWERVACDRLHRRGLLVRDGNLGLFLLCVFITMKPGSTWCSVSVTAQSGILLI